MAFECTVRQCAERLGVSQVRVHQLIKEGALPAEMIAGRYFIDEGAVEARLASSPQPGRPSRPAPRDPCCYTLMNREHEVFEFIYDAHADEFTEVTRLIDPSRAPLGLISLRGKSVSLSALTYWWRHRSIPLSRAGMDAKLVALGLADPARIPFKSLGLSLSDQYWIRPAGSNLDWASVNFFGNPFPEMQTSDWLAQVGLESPDNTSEGQLPKRWVHRKGAPYLLKGGLALDQEPYNEVVATKLYERLLQPGEYAPYTLERLDDGQTVSACKVFLSDVEEYIPAYHVMQVMRRTGGRGAYRHYLECCARLGAEDAETAVAKMIVTDDLIGNTDRHLRNFGLIRNVETLECRPAPLFDTGSSLLSGKAEGALAAGDLSFTTKPFSDDPNQQLRLVSDYSWFDAAALEGFAEDAMSILGQNPALEQRIPAIRNMIEERLERILIIAA